MAIWDEGGWGRNLEVGLLLPSCVPLLLNSTNYMLTGWSVSTSPDPPANFRYQYLFLTSGSHGEQARPRVIRIEGSLLTLDSRGWDDSSGGIRCQ